MKRYLRWIVAAEFLFAAGNLHAVEVEVPGLLTDHTVSSIGHDFYRAFSDKWESDYTGNLTINERPSARWGSWITITVNQDVIFQTFLFPLCQRQDYWPFWGCGRFPGLLYHSSPHCWRYILGLTAPSDNFIRRSLYHLM